MRDVTHLSGAMRCDGIGAVWQSGHMGDIGSCHVSVRVVQKLLGHLHIAALNLEQIIVDSGQHRHHPCKQ